MIKIIVWKPGKTAPRIGYYDENSISAIRIGRSIDNELIIIDNQVSRFHAHIKAGLNGFTVVDLSSTNGTFLKRDNSTTRVHLMQLINGDKVIISEYFIEVSLDSERINSDSMAAAKLIIDDISNSTDPNCSLIANSQSQHSAPVPTPSKNSLRQLLELVLPVDSELEAFCLDNFISVKKIFSGNMDRTTKINILLEREPTHIIAMYLREFDAKNYERYKDVLKYVNQCSNV